MKDFVILLAYVAMLLFDTAIFGGCVWLVGWHGWSAWWFLVAIFIAMGSAPVRVLRAIRGEPVTYSWENR